MFILLKKFSIPPVKTPIITKAVMRITTAATITLRLTVIPFDIIIISNKRYINLYSTVLQSVQGNKVEHSISPALYVAGGGGLLVVVQLNKHVFLHIALFDVFSAHGLKISTNVPSPPVNTPIKTRAVIKITTAETTITSVVDIPFAIYFFMSPSLLMFFYTGIRHFD
jgi:hypothetical protein